MVKKLFGTDGVRGVANQEPMTAQTALNLGKAIAYVASGQARSTGKILVGKDTRISGDMLESALCAGVCSMGADALCVGHMPTPGIAFLTANMRCDAGTVISASHNPYQDNGIKFFARDGFKLSDREEAEIESLVGSAHLDRAGAVPDKIGRTRTLEDALGRYIVFLKNSVPRGMTFDGIDMVLDCANGAAYRAAPAVFEEMGTSVTGLGMHPDGLNINRDCGSLHTQSLRERVLQTGANLGVALDGDADRVIFADEKGNEVDGDQIMGLIAWDMIKGGRLRKNTLVTTVMSNVGLDVAMREMGGSLVRTPVGDRYVVERMRRERLNFGGEQSGHLIFLDHNTSGDGILSALQVIKVMKETGKPLSELAQKVRRFPQVLKNVEVKSRRDWNEIPELRKVIEECNEKLKDSGRLLVRYSGTQLLCRVMAEGENEDTVRQMVDTVADAVSRHL
jgi:phosphoglucosamine mutase